MPSEDTPMPKHWNRGNQTTENTEVKTIRSGGSVLVKALTVTKAIADKSRRPSQ